MTSDDTDAKTRELVEKEGRFGMAEGQIIIVMQDKVRFIGGPESPTLTASVRSGATCVRVEPNGWASCEGRAITSR